MEKYLIEFNIERLIRANGKKGKTRIGNVVINANSETAAKHKFYQHHSCLKGYNIVSIEKMKEKK